MTSVGWETPPFAASCAIKSLTLPFAPDATPRLTILSKRDWHGLAPNLYKLGRGREAPSTSLWSRLRDGGCVVDPLPTSEVEPEPSLETGLVPVPDITASDEEPVRYGACPDPSKSWGTVRCIRGCTFEERILLSSQFKIEDGGHLFNSSENIATLVALVPIFELISSVYGRSSCIIVRW